MENNEKDMLRENFDLEEPTVFEDSSDVIETVAPEAAEIVEAVDAPQGEEAADATEPDAPVETVVEAPQADAALPVEPEGEEKPAPKGAREAFRARKAQAQKKKEHLSAKVEQKQARRKAARASKEELQQELERRKQALQHTTAELSEKLKLMLSD